MNYCPQCTAKLELKRIETKELTVCGNVNCEFIHWDNPTPVVLVIVEYQAKFVVTNNAEWPEWKYSLVSGFVDTRESPEQAAIREVKEELNLTTTQCDLIHTSLYEDLNQIMITFAVTATGDLKLNHENRNYKLLTQEEIIQWQFGRGATPAINQYFSK